MFRSFIKGCYSLWVTLILLSVINGNFPANAHAAASQFHEVFTSGEFRVLAEGKFNYPKGIVIDNKGNLYVADTSNHRVQKFDSSGNYLMQWGSKGDGDGEFYNPNGIAVDNDGNVYVTDTYNKRIQKFNSSGDYITQWGDHGFRDGQFESPNGIVVDNNGNVYVADASNHRIQKFDSSGKYLMQWGTQSSLSTSN